MVIVAAAHVARAKHIGGFLRSTCSFGARSQRCVLHALLEHRLDGLVDGRTDLEGFLAGAFQALVQEINQRLNGSSLTIDDALIERIEHYAYDYGSGGWQTVLRNLLSEIESSPSGS